jgi:hypothetical protein
MLCPVWLQNEHKQRSLVDSFAGQWWLYDSQVAKHLCNRTWSSNQSGGWAILAFSSFLNQIPRQKEPEISVGIFSPT